MISKELIVDTTVELLRQAVTRLPSDVKKALEDAYEREEDEVPRAQLKAILDNVALAEEGSLPMCQDTGIPIFFVDLGNVEVDNVQEAIVEGVKEGTKVIPLRPNVVHPITRKNPGTNVGEHMPYINCRISDNDHIEIGVMPKGAGSENMSALRMLTRPGHADERRVKAMPTDHPRHGDRRFCRHIDQDGKGIPVAAAGPETP
jgi:fumarate hydratase subunit alpha